MMTSNPLETVDPNTPAAYHGSVSDMDNAEGGAGAYASQCGNNLVARRGKPGYLLLWR